MMAKQKMYILLIDAGAECDEHLGQWLKKLPETVLKFLRTLVLEMLKNTLDEDGNLNFKPSKGKTGSSSEGLLYASKRIGNHLKNTKGIYATAECKCQHNTKFIVHEINMKLYLGQIIWSMF